MSQIACKLMTNMRSEAFFICSHGAYTIFLPHGEAENIQSSGAKVVL